MRLFNHIFPSIDMCILHYLSGNRYKYKFINFYLAHKACFPPKFHEVFKRYITVYLSCETIDLNGVTDLIRVLHNNMQSETNETYKYDSGYNSENEENYENIHIETKNDIVSPRSYDESKYQTKKQLKCGLSMKLKNTMQYKFVKTPILIEKHDPNSNKQLLSFVLSCIGTRKRSLLVQNFVNNFIHQLINSRIYYDIDKFKIFKLVYTSWPELELLFLNNEYMISENMLLDHTTVLQSETFIYKLLETCRDAYSHKLYEEIYQLFNTNLSFYRFLNAWLLTIYTHEGTQNYESSNAHNPYVITKTYQLMLYINSRVNNGKNKDQLHILDKMTRVHIEKYITSYTSIHLIMPSIMLTSPMNTVTNLTSSLTTIGNILNMSKNPIIGNIFKEYISNNICDLVEFSNNIHGHYLHNDDNNDDDNNKDKYYSIFLNRTLSIARLVRRYRHFQNIKDLKIIINKYINFVEKSQYYEDTYVKLGISTDDDDNNDDKYKNDTFKIYAYPHIISEIVQFIDFTYPHIKLTKKIYIFLINFFIYITKHPSHWTPPEWYYLLEKITYLLIKYSRNRIKIKFLNHEKNKILIHTLVTTLSKITKDTIETFDTIRRSNSNFTTENATTIINGLHTPHLRKYILQLILRHLDEPTLRKIYYSNIIIYKLINTINQVLFTFTPKSLKSYFSKYPKEQKKIIKYINNNTTEIITCLDNIYGKIIEYDTQDERIMSNDIHKFDSSLVKNIVIDNIFFNPENLKDQRPMSEKDVLKFKHLKPLTYHRIDLTQYPNIAKLEELHVKCKEHMATLKSHLNPQINEENSNTCRVKLDPIMGTPIVTPLALPDCDEVMDRSILEEMLMYNNTNPFTQKNMFMNDVLAYNETEKAKKQIEKFMSSSSE